MASQAYHHGSLANGMGKRAYPGYVHGAATGGPLQHNMSGHHINHPVARQPEGMGIMMSQLPSLSLPGGHMTAGPGMPHMAAHHSYIPNQDGSVAYAGYGVPLPVPHVPEGFPPAAFTAQYPIPGPYNAYHVPLQVIPYTPGRVNTYMERPTDVPGLENRRESYSTTESTPATPYFGSVSDRGNTARIAVVRSAYNTPSPDQGQGPNGLEGAGARKSPAMSDIKLGQLLEQEPKIPQAIPAVFTLPYHVKSLHQCLENRIVGNRNVYIRGLHPTTDDELLLKYAERFGPVEQSKAIIDTTTGACKGFGFAKFVDVRDSEKCIRGFYRLGYEVGFARESFNARLKAEGDDNSTNLYLSNLPKRLTETELNAIFDGYTVVSSKILRDSMGNSRGVGFARFATRDECEDVIKKFHGAPIGEEGMIMQVRYADTPAQKELKRITAERRQFRTNEYNIGAYGTAEVGIHPSIYTHASWNRRAVNGGSGPLAQRPFESSKTQSEPSCNGMQGGKRESTSLSGGTITAGTASASDDEGATIVDSPTVVCGTTQSSPIVKTEHA